MYSISKMISICVNYYTLIIAGTFFFSIREGKTYKLQLYKLN